MSPGSTPSTRFTRALSIGALTACLLTPSALASTTGAGTNADATAERVARFAVTASVETPTLYDDDRGGNASGDDPAIWAHPTTTARSLVIVTAKEGGLRVYDLRGRQLQSLTATKAPRADGVDGRYNNVDIARGLTVGGQRRDVAVVSDRYNDQLRFFAIDPAGTAARTPLREVTAPELPFVFQRNRAGVESEQTAYGLAVWQHDGRTHVSLTQEGTTRIATVRLTSVRGKIGYTQIRHMTLPRRFDLPDGTTWTVCNEPGTGPQLEGMAIDQARGILYAAQEDVGLWRIPLPLDSAPRRLVDTVTDFGVRDRWNAETEECEPVNPSAPAPYAGRLLAADAEGVAIAYGPKGTGHIVVSSQGSDRFAVYALTGANRPLASFRIRGVDGADEVNGSDGLDIVTAPVGPYRRGLLVSHDEPDSGPGVSQDRDPTNFTYVDWGKVADALATDR